MDGRWHHDRTMPQRLRTLAARLGGRSRSGRTALLAAGLVALVLVVAIGAALTRSETPTAAQPPAPSPSPSASSVLSPPVVADSPSPSPTKTTQGPTKAPPTTNPGDAGGHEPDPQPKPPASTPKSPPKPISAPTRPEAFGVWGADTGKYTAKWEYPASDGGSRVTAYVVRKCDGTQLARVGSGTFRVDIYHPHLDCVTVQAVNAKGEGQTAQDDTIPQV